MREHLMKKHLVIYKSGKPCNKQAPFFIVETWGKGWTAGSKRFTAEYYETIEQAENAIRTFCPEREDIAVKEVDIDYNNKK